MAPMPVCSGVTEEKIEIVGAGPAGLFCAIILATAGRRAVVREWHRDVGHRFHDDFQGQENWTGAQNVLDELAEAKVAADFDHSGVTEGVVLDSRARARRVQGARPLFYLLRRGKAAGTLDQSLLARARGRGRGKVQ